MKSKAENNTIKKVKSFFSGWEGVIKKMPINTGAKRFKTTDEWTKPTEEMATGIRIIGSGGYSAEHNFEKPIPVSKLNEMPIVIGKSKK